MRIAYRARAFEMETSLTSVYNKLNGLETHPSSELVRYSVDQFAPLIDPLGGARESWLEGYRVKIMDGNHSCEKAGSARAGYGGLVRKSPWEIGIASITVLLILG